MSLDTARIGQSLYSALKFDANSFSADHAGVVLTLRRSMLTAKCKSRIIMTLSWMTFFTSQRMVNASVAAYSVSEFASIT